MSFGSPADYLPPPISIASINALMKSIGRPEPISVVSSSVTAAYHSIYIINEFIDSGPKTKELILRVSGQHIPNIKTINEVAVLQWISKNTNIPVPDILAYDASIDNAISNEYMLLPRVHGHVLSDIYQSLSDTEMSSILDQLIDVLIELHAVEWKAIGGLTFNINGEIVVGPVLEETFWQIPEIRKFWPLAETIETLNIKGPFPSYVDYVSAHVEKYIYAIKRHEKLAFMRDIIPRIEAFLVALEENAELLNNIKLRLAHKDLHFANILFDRDSCKITSILDWEFSGVVPFTRWNPSRAFLWNGQYTEDSTKEKNRLMEVFKARCSERNVTLLEDAEFTSPLQEAMQTVATFLRAIVEVAPRDEKHDAVGGWKDKVLSNMAIFGV